MFLFLAGFALGVLACFGAIQAFAYWVDYKIDN